MSDDDLAQAAIQPVGKQLAVDLYGLGYAHVSVEGLAIVDETTIVVVNDNNFNPDEPTELMFVRLATPVR